jgi:hypothetical protein
MRMRARPAESAKAREGRGTGPGRNWSASALFDRVFWLGDFNYRLEAEAEDVRRGLDLGDKGIAQLLEFDQLLDQARQGKVRVKGLGFAFSLTSCWIRRGRARYESRV